MNRVVTRIAVMAVVFGTSLTATAIRYAAAREPNWPLEQPEAFKSVLTTGIMPPRGEDGKAFIGYFAHPTEVVSLCEGMGFEVVTVLGVEGLVSMIETEINTLSGKAWEVWAAHSIFIISSLVTR